MAFTVRKGSAAVLAALVLGHNNSRRATAFVASFFHADVTSEPSGDHTVPVATAGTITAPNASDLATSLVLVNQLRKRWMNHYADDLAHKVADTTNTLAAAVATDLATAQTLANEIKADYNAHIASTTFHYTADGTNTTAAANATDQATLNTLLNELKTDFNAHIASAPAGQSIKVIDA